MESYVIVLVYDGGSLINDFILKVGNYFFEGLCAKPYVNLVLTGWKRVFGGKWFVKEKLWVKIEKKIEDIE